MRFLTSHVFICPPVFCVFSFCFLPFRFLCTRGFLCCFNVSFLPCFLWVFLILRATLFRIEAQTTLKLSFLSQEKQRFLSQSPDKTKALIFISRKATIFIITVRTTLKLSFLSQEKQQFLSQQNKRIDFYDNKCDFEGVPDRSSTLMDGEGVTEEVTYRPLQSPVSRFFGICVYTGANDY
ncbi:hypothetical protein AAZX31_03G103200 [Glycine max]